MPFLLADSVCMPNMQGVTDTRHKDDSNMCNDGRHEECVERSFMPESKPLGMASYPSSIKFWSYMSKI